MIVLDTNVISELARIRPSPDVADAIKKFSSGDIYTTAVTEAELLFGVEILPQGRRRAELQAQLEQFLNKDLAGRILPFDSVAARAYAKLSAARRAEGRPISYFDAQIAAIVQVNDATLVTGNSRDFEGCGIDVINPWITRES